MILKTFTSKHVPALTSDRWHVIHSKYTKKKTKNSLPYTRSIVSEHDDREKAVHAARILLFSLRRKAAARPRQEKDQVFVRPPKFRSLRSAHRRKAKTIQ